MVSAFIVEFSLIADPRPLGHLNADVCLQAYDAEPELLLTELVKSTLSDLVNSKCIAIGTSSISLNKP